VRNAFAYVRRCFRKLREWSARYLPAEIIGTTAAVTCAFVVYHNTGDRAAAAISGTMAENVGFYGVMLFCEWRRQRRASPDGFLRITGRTLRVMFAEFGAAEALDSLLLRPASLYSGPILTGEIATGSLLGKVMADAVFYALAIVSYEIAQYRARAKGASVGATGQYALAGHGPGLGSAGVPGDGFGVAWSHPALRHEVQSVSTDADTIEIRWMPVRDRVRDRAGGAARDRSRPG